MTKRNLDSLSKATFVKSLVSGVVALTSQYVGRGSKCQLIYQKTSL
jgi:hypothetical protein